MPSILLKNGTALIHDANDHVDAIVTDILIEGDKIKKIAKDISAPGAEVIDCSDKLISPGFVDTHHHVWQTQYKGRHANETLVQYMASGNLTSQLLDPADAFWGQLAGCMEMVHGGTTTVVDYCHVTYSGEHARKAISATVASGIRSVFCYAAMAKVTSWKPVTIDLNGLAGNVMADFEDVAKEGPYGDDGRVTVGFAFDGFPYLPKEYAGQLMSKLDDLQIEVITIHHTWWDLAGTSPTGLEKVDQTGVLDNRFLLAHSGNSTQADAAIMKKHGLHVSATPSTEMQMSMGLPVMAYRTDLGIQHLCSFGVDCHSNNSAYIPDEARVGLQGARAARAQPHLDKGKIVSEVGPTVEETFNLATIFGARGAKMGDKTGSIAEGKFADLVLFDMSSPAMVAASIHNPIAAIILHSSPADIDTVIVGGQIRKRAGKLLPVAIDSEGKSVAGKDTLDWPEIAKAVVKSREGLQKQVDGIDMVEATDRVKDWFHITDSMLVDIP
ncbi:hypothetical protein PRZ48_004515 [Zasmidium cellare]|uniref:Amidohydrolase-related domain-containing protein n=1 Tax=Zasmidium cellare TaxID=395010 RepID=A0ABR0EQ21_ZASCE|nr:hypothetical protein PRZ48_004515 [Zasmidium cellare]